MHKTLNYLVISLICLFAHGAFLAVSADGGLVAALELMDKGEYQQAFNSMQNLAEQDYVEAQYHLGMLYLFGQGVPQNSEQGIDWLKRAAANGSYRAAAELGQIYIAGRGVAQDEAEAIKWIELSTNLAQEDEANQECD